MTLHAGQTRCTLHFDPVTAAGGWQLECNRHRLTVERRAEILHDQVLADSPLQTALRSTIDALLGTDPMPPPDLLPLQRIATIAELLHTQQTLGIHQTNHDEHTDLLRSADAASVAAR